LTATATVTCTKPSCEITGPAVSCAGATQGYSATPTTGVSYSWSIDPPAAGTIQTGQGTSSITVHWSSSGTVKLHVVYPDDTDRTTPVTVTPNPTCEITGPAASCAGATQGYSATPTTGVTYAWSIDPPAAGTIQTGQGTSSITVLWSSSGTVKLHVVSTDNTD